MTGTNADSQRGRAQDEPEVSGARRWRLPLLALLAIGVVVLLLLVMLLVAWLRGGDSGQMERETSLPGIDWSSAAVTG